MGWLLSDLNFGVSVIFKFMVDITNYYSKFNVRFQALNYLTFVIIWNKMKAVASAPGTYTS